MREEHTAHSLGAPLDSLDALDAAPRLRNLFGLRPCLFSSLGAASRASREPRGAPRLYAVCYVKEVFACSICL